jgi:uncharacterized protein (TIGR01244 family)
MKFSRQFVRSGAAALAVAALLAIPTPGQAQTVNGSTSATVVAKPGIENFGQIGPTYYRGAQPKGRDYADLAALGIKTLINLTSDDGDASEPTMTERAGMRYVHIPMTTRLAPTPSQLEQFLSIVTAPANQPVYVHCVGGRHRTGVMTAVYRMTHDGWSSEQAFAEMKRYKFGADMLHPEFKTFVYGYRADAAAAPAAAVAAGSKAAVK